MNFVYAFHDGFATSPALNRPELGHHLQIVVGESIQLNQSTAWMCSLRRFLVKYLNDSLSRFAWPFAPTLSAWPPFFDPQPISLI